MTHRIVGGDGQGYRFNRGEQRWEPSPRRRRWPLVAATLIGVGAIGAVASSTGGGGTTSGPGTAASTSAATAVATVRSAPTSAKTAPVSSVTAPPTSFGPGTYEVGVDMAAGRYKTKGTNGLPCYWARSGDDSGELQSLIANGILDGPGSVTVKKGEFFSTSGCKPWVKA